MTSRVRFDNLQDARILEYRNSAGDVVRQYPTEAQIQAFKHAENLTATHVQDAKSEQSADTQAQSSSGSSTSADDSASAASSPAPRAGDIVAAAASYSPPAAPHSTQSTTA